MTARRPLRVLIDAQIQPGETVGGVSHYIAGIIWGLGRLTDGDEEYVILHSVGHRDWLVPLMGPNQRLVEGPRKTRRRWPLLFQTLVKVRDQIGRVASTTSRFQIARSGGFYESQGAHVVHLPHARFVRSTLPTVYNPHDLQHRHYPQFFPRTEVSRRETVLKTGILESESVIALSNAAAEDFKFSYEFDHAKVKVVPPAPALHDACICPAPIPGDLPETFLYYPAQTWPHKNHLRLIEAVAWIRRQHSISLHLVLTGSLNWFWPQVAERAKRLGISEQVHPLGYRSQCEVTSLYRAATIAVLPSLFEGGGLPAIEAMSEGTPVVCSKGTSLHEYAGDAAAVFDPESVTDMATVIHRVFVDSALRDEMRSRGRARASRFTWEATARSCREIYRSLASRKA